MPNSRENEWSILGFNSEAEFVQANINWEQMIADFMRMRDAINRMVPVLERAAQIIRENQGANVMAVDIRHSEFPRRDGDGTYWYDPSTFHGERGRCFICRELTHRIDIDYHGHFCGSDECNAEIIRDLERANGGPEVRD